MEKQIKAFVSNMWWLWVGISGLTMLFGLVAIVEPGLIVRMAAALVALAVILAAIFQLARGVRLSKTREDWWVPVILGGILLILGVYLAKNFIVSVTIFAILLGWTLILRGLIDLAVAHFVDNEGGSWWKASAIAGVAAGVITIIFPLGSTTLIAWVIGLYALFSGGVMLMRAYQVRPNITTTKKK